MIDNLAVSQKKTGRQILMPKCAQLNKLWQKLLFSHNPQRLGYGANSLANGISLPTAIGAGRRLENKAVGGV